MASSLYAGTLWSRVETFDADPTGSASGGETFLLLGSDSRSFVTTADDRMRYGGPDDTPGERADVLIALRVDDDGAARILTISRDLLVVAPGGGLERVSETLIDGPQGVADALCRSIGLGVDHLLVLRLDGLRRIVNAVGGIDLVLDAPVRDEGSGLRLGSGNVHLDGDQAIAFVGARQLEHQDERGRWVTDPTDSADRPGRAVELLRLIGAGLGLSAWSPIQTSRVMWAASGSISADDSVGLGEMNRLRGVVSDLGHVDAIRLPVTTNPGFVPVDQLGEGAGQALDDFEGSGGDGGGCGEPALPAARRG